MNKRDRLFTTLDHREPDAVPITELAIDPVHLESLLATNITDDSPSRSPSDRRRREGRMVDALARVHLKLGFEMIACEPSAADSWHSELNPDGTINDEWGRLLSFDPTSKVWVQNRSIFKTMKEVEEFQLPDPNAPGRLFGIERTRKIIGDEILEAGLVRDPFALAWEMFAITNFVRWLYENPTFIRSVLDRITEYNIKLAKHMIDAGVDLIVCDGDYCEKNGPLVPVKFFKDVIIPNLRRQADVVHKAGLKFIKHTDGNINPILHDLASVVDGLHSLDPSAGVDLKSVKATYGDKLTLMGNVSCDNLCIGNREDIVEETRNCLRIAAPGGGYVLSSSNSWYTNAKLENCLAMVETGRKYGHYPIEYN